MNTQVITVNDGRYQYDDIENIEVDDNGFVYLLDADGGISAMFPACQIVVIEGFDG